VVALVLVAAAIAILWKVSRVVRGFFRRAA